MYVLVWWQIQGNVACMLPGHSGACNRSDLYMYVPEAVTYRLGSGWILQDHGNWLD